MARETPEVSVLTPESGEVDAVLNWLNTLDLAETATPFEVQDVEVTAYSTFAANGARSRGGCLTPSVKLSISTKGSNDDPRTPQRDFSEVVAIEDVSPTNTDFTNFYSVFDSPTPGARDDAASEISSVNSVCGEQYMEHSASESLGDCEEAHIGRLEPAQARIDDCQDYQGDEVDIATANPEFDAESLNSYDPPSSASSSIGEFQDPTLLHSTLQKIISKLSAESQFFAKPPTGPQLVFITDCYQCLLAGLPCSRTLTCCSRCKRSEQRDLCLLQRRKLQHEMVPGDAIRNTTPVLLLLEKVDETIWKKKLELLSELQETWKLQKDRKNWTLPALESSPRVKWNKKNSQKAVMEHPGEGLGRQTFVDVRLAWEQE